MLQTDLLSSQKPMWKYEFKTLNTRYPKYTNKIWENSNNDLQNLL